MANCTVVIDPGQAGVLGAIKAHDPATKDRGVKDQVLSVLKDSALGSGVRACLSGE